ncbi:unnamed protein product [Clavelina lepadiformis]|uniref:Zinc finger CCHC domain-containing protein 4 n=2 Tax=Clavelina lepadiformis TaxID=159417 RepID=A0ABP0F3F9_CLALP
MSCRKRKNIPLLPVVGFEVRFEEDWPSQAPSCYHGPMLLFDKYVDGRKVETFYACSAQREGKNCSSKTQMPWNHEMMSYDDVIAIHPTKRKFCCQCQKFIREDDSATHIKHEKKTGITNADLIKPSLLFLTPKENTKTNAQYFLSHNTISFLHSTLKRLQISHVVNIGMPRLHEHIQHEIDGTMKSILLDIDERFSMFWPREKFLQFNMFNQHFFHDGSEEIFDEFLQNRSKRKNIAVVLDPPFGGLVDCIVQTIKWMSSRTMDEVNESKKFSIFWIFPYFMEKRITDNFPFMSMLDFQVDYDNHKKFKNALTGRKASPVRIFTNVENERIVLPGERYRFCVPCRRYVSVDNDHCKLCNSCPSKDGRKCRHCEKCKKCVKSSKLHCDSCKRCQIPSHTCRIDDVTTCHLCGEGSHRRKHCPSLGAPPLFK